MFKVFTYNESQEDSYYFAELHEAKHFAIDNAYQGFSNVIYDNCLPDYPKRLYRTERFGGCFAVVPL